MTKLDKLSLYDLICMRILQILISVNNLINQSMQTANIHYQLSRSHRSYSIVFKGIPNHFFVGEITLKEFQQTE